MTYTFRCKRSEIKIESIEADSEKEARIYLDSLLDKEDEDYFIDYLLSSN